MKRRPVLVTIAILGPASWIVALAVVIAAQHRFMRPSRDFIRAVHRAALEHPQEDLATKVIDAYDTYTDAMYSALEPKKTSR